MAPSPPDATRGDRRRHFGSRTARPDRGDAHEPHCPSTHAPPRPQRRQRLVIQPALEAQLPWLRQRLLRHARFAVHDDNLARHGAGHLDRRDGTAFLGVVASRRSSPDSNSDPEEQGDPTGTRSPVRRRMVQFKSDDDSIGEAIDALYDADGAYADPVPAWQQPDNRTEQRRDDGAGNAA